MRSMCMYCMWSIVNISQKNIINTAGGQESNSCRHEMTKGLNADVTCTMPSPCLQHYRWILHRCIGTKLVDFFLLVLRLFQEGQELFIPGTTLLSFFYFDDWGICNSIFLCSSISTSTTSYNKYNVMLVWCLSQ